jgi:hypothetical protein
LTEKEIIDRFATRLREHSDNKKLLDNDTVKRLLNISKRIAKNDLNQ